MTVKDVEERSGMTRANIRFYEAEGLVSPGRSANGYRDYSENDVEILKRIKLLRTLHISLEEIRALHTGEEELLQALDRHLAALALDRADIERAQEICKVMRDDGVRYQTLDAQYYLDEIESITQKPVPVPAADATARVRAPWRRYLARYLDTTIYGALWSIFQALVLHVNISNRSTGGNLLDIIVTILLVFALEPVLLSRLGTTPGKWILGLSVTDNEDRRLSYSAALSRLWTVFCRGRGFYIPIYNLVREWKSYKACSEGETLEWEYDSTLVLRDERGWRIGAYIGVHIIVVFALAVTMVAAEMPKHRGDITVAQFCENYNRLANYLDLDSAEYLDETGAWAEKESNVRVVNLGGYGVPKYVFTQEDGLMTGLTFSTELHNGGVWAPSHQSDMLLCVLSFVRAQPGYNPFSRESKNVINGIQEAPFEDFEFTQSGVTMTCQVEYSGYMDSASLGWLFPQEGAETEYYFRFTMTKE